MRWKEAILSKNTFLSRQIHFWITRLSASNAAQQYGCHSQLCRCADTATDQSLIYVLCTVPMPWHIYRGNPPVLAIISLLSMPPIAFTVSSVAVPRYVTFRLSSTMFFLALPHLSLQNDLLSSIRPHTFLSPLFLPLLALYLSVLSFVFLMFLPSHLWAWCRCRDPVNRFSPDLDQSCRSYCVWHCSAGSLSLLQLVVPHLSHFSHITPFVFFFRRRFTSSSWMICDYSHSHNIICCLNKV